MRIEFYACTQPKPAECCNQLWGRTDLESSASRASTHPFTTNCAFLNHQASSSATSRQSLGMATACCCQAPEPSHRSILRVRRRKCSHVATMFYRWYRIDDSGGGRCECDSNSGSGAQA